MRMWMIDPKLMCKKHLLGEHVELHMLVGSINRNRSLNGFIRNGLIDTREINNRHTDLTNEMKRRGYKHTSELIYTDELKIGEIDILKNYKELCSRCSECRKNILKLK